jgi:hypothetical protein
LYSGRARSNLDRDTAYLETFCGLPQSLQVNYGSLWAGTRTLPFKSSPFHHSPVILPFDATYELSY